MKAISIRQPGAWLVVNGNKDINNPSSPTKYRGQYPDSPEGCQRHSESRMNPPVWNSAWNTVFSSSCAALNNSSSPLSSDGGWVSEFQNKNYADFQTAQFTRRSRRRQQRGLQNHIKPR